MHPRKSRHPKRFSETKGIVIAVENPSKSLSNQKPSVPIRPVTINNGSRRSNKHFDRFDTKSSPITVTRLVPEESSHSDTSSDLVHLLHQFEKRIKTMLIAHKEETVKAVIEAIKHHDINHHDINHHDINHHDIKHHDIKCNDEFPSSVIHPLENKTDYIPFFNSPETISIHNTTHLSKDNYLKFQVELLTPLEDEPIIYPFGHETLSIVYNVHELNMSFKTESGKKGHIEGTLRSTSLESFPHPLIQNLQWFLEDGTPLEFSDIDTPLTVTFYGGLL